MTKYFVSLLIIVTGIGSAMATDVIAHKGETLVLPINSKMGTLIELPAPLKVIPASAHFNINAVATEVDPKNRNPININIVNVKPRGRLHHEKIPFLLSNGKTINVQLIPRTDSTRHYKVKFLRTGLSYEAVFLGSEIALMKQMLKDEPGSGFSRNIVNVGFNFKALNGLKIRLKRRFKGKGLIGYVFHVNNNSKEKRYIKPKDLRFDQKSNAVLMQVDNKDLESCRLSKSIKKCSTALRIVLRESSYVYPGSASDFPFVSSKSKGDGR